MYPYRPPSFLLGFIFCLILVFAFAIGLLPAIFAPSMLNSGY